MLYLPKKTYSSYESKLVHMPSYYKTFKFDKDISDEELINKAQDIIAEYVKLGYICSNNYFIKDKIKAVNIPIDKNNIYLDYSINYLKKSIVLSFDDNSRCYCLKCKEIVNTKTTKYEIQNSNGLCIDAKLYMCPNCNTSSTYNNLKKQNAPYTLFNECYLDDNKLKIKRKTISFHEYNNRVFAKKQLDVIVMNLDTGMTYRLPAVIDGKINKKMSLKNISYNGIGTPELNCERYNNNCKDIQSIFLKAFNLIREYKIKHNNFYIPTLKEQAAFALSKGQKKTCIYNFEVSFDSSSNKNDQILNSSQNLELYHLIKLNRFPALNMYLNDDFYGLRNSYLYDSKIYNKLKRIRGKIKQDSNNPIKDLALNLNIPYSRALKNIFNSNIAFMFLYKNLIGLNIKRDNILKLFNIAYDKEKSFNIDKAISIINNFAKTYNIIKDFPTYNENNFINKIVNFSNKYSGNYTYIIDTFYAIRNIRSYEDYSDYVVDLRMDFKSLHDKVISDEKKIKTKNHTISYTDEQLLINGTFNNLNFYLAKDTYELIDVGTKMHICVGGYGSRAINHSCYIVIARDINTNEPIICIEIDKNFKYLEQTKLKYNQHPSEESNEYKAILQWCNHANLLPINYEINSYSSTKAFLVKHKDLVEEYNDTALSFNKINLDELSQDIKEVEIDNVALII